MQEGIDLSTLDFTAIEVEAIAKDFGWVKEPVDAKEYYTIGMAVMNVLFIASTIGSYAYREKRTHVFNRIIVADIPIKHVSSLDRKSTRLNSSHVAISYAVFCLT